MSELRDMPGCDRFLEGLIAGRVPIFPTLVSEKTGSVEMPFVPIRAIDVSERRLELFNKPTPLTEEERAEFEACESNFIDVDGQ